MLLLVFFFYILRTKILMAQYDGKTKTDGLVTCCICRVYVYYLVFALWKYNNKKIRNTKKQSLFFNFLKQSFLIFCCVPYWWWWSAIKFVTVCTKFRKAKFKNHEKNRQKPSRAQKNVGAHTQCIEQLRISVECNKSIFHFVLFACILLLFLFLTLIRILVVLAYCMTVAGCWFFAGSYFLCVNV